MQKEFEKVSAEQDQVIEPVSEPVIVEEEHQLEMDFDAIPEVVETVKPKPEIIATEIETTGVTIEKIAKPEPEGDYMLDTEGRSIHKDALKSLHPELFLQVTDRASSTAFGTVFPTMATKGDIFVRVDQMPNRVYKFEGKSWIEVQKEVSDTYLYDEEYIKHLVAKIQTGEYDVDLLSESERQQIEIYLTDNKG